jgi:hypothetical protein
MAETTACVLASRPFFAGGKRIEPGQMVRLSPSDAIGIVGAKRGSYATPADREVAIAGAIAADAEACRATPANRDNSWSQHW